MEDLLRDVRIGFRSLSRTPGFTAVAVAILALGIGANTSIYSIVHAVILEPLDFESPHELVSVWEQVADDAGALRKSRVTAANFRDWREQSASFESLALFSSASVNWAGSGDAELLRGAAVTDNYFALLGVEPILGRFFGPDDGRPGADPVAVLGHGLWQRRFGEATDVVGRIMSLNGVPVEIIGVAPAGVYPTRPQNTGRLSPLPAFQQIFLPVRFAEERWADRRSHVFGVIGRLAAGSTLESVRAEMDTVAARLEAAHPSANEGMGILVQPYMEEIYGSHRDAMLLLLGAVGVVLLIACANIAALFLARSHGRRREIAVRAALGASRLTLVRQMLMESLVLASVAGVVGVLVALVSVDFLVVASPEEIPRLAEASVQPAALAFALVVSLAVSLLVGLTPAVTLSRHRTGDGTRIAEPGSFGSGLVVAEVALAVMLVVSAGLLLQSFAALRDVDLGFRHSRVLVGELELPPGASYPDAGAISRFYTELIERLTALPSVSHASLAYDHPLDSNWGDSFRIVGGTEIEESMGATLRIVTPGYFETVGLDVIDGRPFTELDDPAHPGVVIVNEAFARSYFAGGEVLGRVLATSTPNRMDAELPETFEIVGVVRNIKFLGPRAEDEPAFYLPSRQFPLPDMALLVRTEQAPEALATRVQDTLRALDPNLPVPSLTTLDRLADRVVAAPRFNTVLASVFGTAALVLAVLGIYGLLAFEVAARTREIGLRIALGAPGRQVVGLIVRRSTLLTALGIALGLAGSWLVSRALAPLVFGIGVNDPSTFVAVAVALLGASLLASYLPARRASRIAPTEALRYE